MRHLFAVCAAGLLAAGCWSTKTTELDPDDPVHLRASWDYTDQKAAVEKMTQSMVANPRFVGIGTVPVVVAYPFQNDTTEHVNMQLISDKVTTSLLSTGRIRLVEKDIRNYIDEEVAHQQGGKVDPATAAKLRNQLGATHLLWGRLASVEKEEGKGLRASRKEIKYYNLTLKLSNLSTGEVIWADEKEIARQESRPLFGW